ncbi:hypothetical protein IW147_004429 [Coemansia sp. RSA 720]|nr:hypothetical protein LPJ76_002801 [Coemansia sp. RSA 638]KAJ2121264.1 hypothetical protein IW147_004429 [Coemansia sp. RSA 720]KAJ2545178.1 hypothetical protein GGF49_000611 [Coemansia sp. RSA 1853]
MSVSGGSAEGDSHLAARNGRAEVHPAAHNDRTDIQPAAHKEEPSKRSGAEKGSTIKLLQSPTPGKRRKRRAQRASSGFNTDDVDIDVKNTWCNDNTNFCQNVCLNLTWGSPINDGCEPSSLQWHCTCGNGKNPDPDTFTFPVMHYQCQYEVHQCQVNCATGDIRCTQECQGDRNCTAPNDPNNGKTTVPETDDATDGLDSSDGAATDPVNFFSAASVLSTGGYVALTALVATSLHFMGVA